MNIDPHAQSASPADGSTPTPAPALSGEAQSRRRLLMKGLGKGAAVAAVMVPINTLATPQVLKLCTVSGMQSNVGSGRSGVKTNECLGYSPTYYSNILNWPNYVFIKGRLAINHVDGIEFYEGSLFSAVFGPGAVLGGLALLDILTNHPTSDEAVWISALLNAIKAPPTFKFPYTASQVRAYYNSTDPVVRSNALTLFRGYLQGVGA